MIDEPSFPVFNQSEIIWKSKVSSKVQVLVWIIAYVRVIPTTCFYPLGLLCVSVAEDSDNLFFHSIALMLCHKHFREAELSCMIPASYAWLFIKKLYVLEDGNVSWKCCVMAAFR